MRKDRYGFEIEDFLEIEAGSYKDESGNEIQYEGIILDTVLLFPAWKKEIVTTSIKGRKGTVKEYIAEGDCSISIKGILVTEKEKQESSIKSELTKVAKANLPFRSKQIPLSELIQKPKEQLRILKKILAAPVPLKIICPYLNELGINEIVVESYTFPQAEGAGNYQKFDILAMSNQDLEITLEQEV
jgi:hypothetical protein